MATWEAITEAAPDFAQAVRRRFDAHGLATLRRDGSPRISGIEASFRDGELWLAGMPGSVKFLDLRRDPRLALHSASEDPEIWTGDAKVGGRAVAVTDAGALAAFAGAGQGSEAPSPGSFELFRVELSEAVLVQLGDPADHLVIESWHDGTGLRRVERR
ncbi:MAG: pyridoxamine 5'-phosphate oxidase family protein [Actinomycetota bacterium]|nr:pyridoxamine 5'-phosphate oxidase family protein [Actinomycetota bacterium]